MKILVVSPSLPVSLNNGGSIRIFNLVKHLSDTEEIDFLSLDDGFTTGDEMKSLQKLCTRLEVVVPKKRSTLDDYYQIGRKMIMGEPFYTKYVDFPEFKERLREMTQATKYDIIHFEHSHLAGLLNSAECGINTRSVLSTHNVAFDQFRRMSRFERNPIGKLKLMMTSLPMKKWEPSKAATFDTVITVCERDRQLLLSVNPALDIEVIPNGVDTEVNRPYPRKGRNENILIVGSFDYQPNADAVLYFIRQIFPLIRKQIPQCTLTIAGRYPPGSIRMVHRPPLVTVCADAPDVKPYYEKALVSIVALRSGGGSRLKILEALALGTPVVSTHVGCEGLEVQNGRDILIADDPIDFACKVVKLIRDAELWHLISNHGYRLVQDHYDWRQIAEKLRTHYFRCLNNTITRKSNRSRNIQE